MGFICGVSAFVFWGLAPIYFKALQHVPSTNILAHRVVWSVPLTALLICLG
ncbi:MAG: EamA family transporter RarD, partial [Deltaproteobacteria bacterium]|nr:EamA family transporter RarD [Deltaproteobacteria bacterium]